MPEEEKVTEETSDFKSVEISDSDFEKLNLEQQGFSQKDEPKPDEKKPPEGDEKPPEDDKKVVSDEGDKLDFPKEPKENDEFVNPDNTDEKFKFDGKDWEKVELSKIKIGDEEYTEDEIKDAFTDSKNKKDWQKANTKEAQKLADDKKKISLTIEFREKLKNNPSAIKDLEELIGEKEVDEFMNADLSTIKHPAEEKLAKEKETNELLQAEKELDEEAKTLMKTHKISQSRADEIKEEALKLCEETKQAYTLEQVYKMKNYPKIKDDLAKAKDDLKKLKEEKKKPEVPDVDSGGVATNIKTDKKVKSFEEISVDGYDLFE